MCIISLNSSFFSLFLCLSTVPGWIRICTKQGGEVFVHLRDRVHIPRPFTGECVLKMSSPPMYLKANPDKLVVIEHLACQLAKCLICTSAETLMQDAYYSLLLLARI